MLFLNFILYLALAPSFLYSPSRVGVKHHYHHSFGVESPGQHPCLRLLDEPMLPPPQVSKLTSLEEIDGSALQAAFVPEDVR